MRFLSWEAGAEVCLAVAGVGAPHLTLTHRLGVTGLTLCLVLRGREPPRRRDASESVKPDRAVGSVEESLGGAFALMEHRREFNRSER